MKRSEDETSCQQKYLLNGESVQAFIFVTIAIDDSKPFSAHKRSKYNHKPNHDYFLANENLKDECLVW